MNNSTKTDEIVAPGFRFMRWRFLTVRMIVSLIMFSVFIMSFVPQVEALTSGLELSPAKMSIDQPIRPGGRVSLKNIKVTNTGDSTAEITIMPKGAIQTDVKNMRLEPGVSGWFEAWLEVPKDAEAGQHEDTIDVKAIGADKMNNIMLQVVVKYETSAVAAASVNMDVISEYGIYAAAILFVITAYFLLKAKRRTNSAYARPQPANLARLHSVVQPWASSQIPSSHPYSSPHVPNLYPQQQFLTFSESENGPSLAERLAAYRRNERGGDEV